MDPCQDGLFDLLSQLSIEERRIFGHIFDTWPPLGEVTVNVPDETNGDLSCKIWGITQLAAYLW